MLTKCWQLESETVAFASVMPGIIDTDMQVIARSDINPDLEHSGFYKKLKEENRLVSPDTVAAFLTWLLLDVDKGIYVSQEWDIYDTKHHQDWLKLPNQDRMSVAYATQRFSSLANSLLLFSKMVQRRHMGASA